MAIECIISGAKDSEADYEEDVFNRGDEVFRQAVQTFYETGARIDNISEAVAGALEDADAEA